MHLQTEQGLSSNVTGSILQDKKGFIWIGTDAGLNRYDGNSIKIYKHTRNNNSISNDIIKCLFEDRDTCLWIGTELGLNKYDPQSDYFSTFLASDNKKSLSDNTITAVTQGKHLWVGTINGLNQVDTDTDGITVLKQFFYDPNDSLSLSNNRIYSLFTDSQGIVWIGTEGGGLNYISNNGAEKKIHRFPKNSGFTGRIVYSIYEHEDKIIVGTEAGVNIIKKLEGQYKIQTFQPYEIKNAPVYSFTGDNDHNIWIGTFGSGLTHFNLNNGTFHNYLHNRLDASSLSRNFVYSVMKAKDGIVWLSTRETGVDRIDPNIQRFAHIRNEINNPNPLSNNVVKAITEDKNGNIWIGTYGGGLNKYNPKTKQFTAYRHQAENPNSIASDIIESLCFDHQNRLWLGTAKGLDLFDPSTNTFTHFQHDENNPNSITNNNIWSVCASKDKKSIWIATYDGLNHYDWTTKRFTHFKNDPDNPNSLSFNFLRAVYEDQYNQLWVCTWGGGLDKLNLSKTADLKNAKFEHYRYHLNNTNGISSDLINTIFVENEDICWIGTQQGLNKYQRSTNSFTQYNIEDGLIGNVVKAIVKDDKGFIWISTQNGISKLNPIDNSFSNYNKHDGLQGNIFNLSSAIVLKNGELMFGGNNGLSHFNPNLIVESSSFPTVYFDELRINNHPIKPHQLFNERLVLSKNLNADEKLVLNHNENNINFSFGAIEYSAPHKIHFKYQLKGADLEWNHTESKNLQVTYSGLRPGTYVFKVRSTNLNGDWNSTGPQKTIVILPPWWMSTTAYMAYCLIIIASSIALIYIVRRKQHIKQQRFLKEEEQKNNLQLEQFKLQFFTNISHEIRTPLTLITGPVEQLLNTPTNNPEQEYQLKTVQRNTNILLRLINQLLDFRKLEKNKLNLNVSQHNISGLIQNYIESFKELAQSQNIQIEFKDKVSSTLPVDSNFLDKIMFNLISNAIKYTPHGGYMTIELRSPSDRPSVLIDESDSYYCISVKDNGVGIAKDKQQYIFDRFTQIEDQHQLQSGTGIGLSFTKSLVETHLGHIHLESEPGLGSTFYVFLPSEIQSYPTESITETANETNINQSKSQDDLDSIPLETSTDNNSSDQATILIIEDNQDMRIFIQNTLKNTYKVITAENGKVGFTKAMSENPDLIISDIMMPIMDGLELCKNIKSEIKTSHIPVVLLTAKNTNEDELQGFDIGADHYITKPFNLQKLQYIVRNTLSSRQMLRNKFGSQHMPSPKEITVTSADERFYEKLNELLEQEISNSELSVEWIADQIGLSSVHLYRKLKSIAGMTPSKYIRSFRLKRAVQLLEQNKLRISEIAYMAGFTDPKYFRKCFKQEFDVSPSEYVKRKA
ncbi:MAG: response regulator [Carboxylicivirga sp.]|jgi:signal transduction histidine kinase/ligand-binding sensor domain-containing protein/DNA-binding response OmpR family regulator|nr:response regulator [Carboxylicivirga sp.]